MMRNHKVVVSKGQGQLVFQIVRVSRKGIVNLPRFRGSWLFLVLWEIGHMTVQEPVFKLLGSISWLKVEQVKLRPVRNCGCLAYVL